MFCSKCGEKILDEAVICPKCGCKTGVEESQIQEIDEPKTGIGVFVGLISWNYRVDCWIMYI